MRFMMILKAHKLTEAGGSSDRGGSCRHGEVQRGAVQGRCDARRRGIEPTSQGARVTFKGGKAEVTDGPFTETQEVIAGYWMIQVKSKEEAIEWAKRVPFRHIPQNNGMGEIELRSVYELEDFAPGEAVEHHRALGEQLAKKQQ
jgi:PhnB protein